MPFVSKAPLVCVHCGEEDERRSSRQKYCKRCVPHKSARMRILRYGVAQWEIDEMYAKQGGVCALCREYPGTELDHDHQTGEARGLLCVLCNLALGRYERKDWRERVEAYAVR